MSHEQGPSFREAVLIHAVARLALYPEITNIQASCRALQGVAVGCCSVLQCMLQCFAARRSPTFRQVAGCCSVLQGVAVSCSVLQCVAVFCSVLQCVAVCCSVLQCVVVHYNTMQQPLSYMLQSVAECCSVLQCNAVYDKVLQSVAKCCSVLRSVAVCSSPLYLSVPCDRLCRLVAV